MEIVYGHTMTSADDVFVKRADRAIQGTVDAGQIPATLIDLFPFCALSCSKFFLDRLLLRRFSSVVSTFVAPWYGFQGSSARATQAHPGNIGRTICDSNRGHGERDV